MGRGPQATAAVQGKVRRLLCPAPADLLRSHYLCLHQHADQLCVGAFCSGPEGRALDLDIRSMTGALGLYIRVHDWSTGPIHTGL